MNKPYLVALLFAEQVITEDNQKKKIIGTFSNISSDEFPVTVPIWYIYAAVTNLKGEYKFSFKLTNDKTKEDIMTIEGHFGVINIEVVMEMGIPVNEVVFPCIGNYILNFSIDGEIIGTRLLTVSKRKQSK